jgi:hypothetical protein
MSPSVLEHRILPRMQTKPVISPRLSLHKKGTIRYPFAAIQEAKDIFATFRCKNCNKPLTSARTIFCSPECYVIGTKFINISPERKEKRKASIKRWADKNPDKVKIINHRAQLKYQNKQRLALIEASKEEGTIVIPTGQ